MATPLVLYIALVIYRIPFVIEKERTEKTVAQIHAQKLTIEDVNGEHLPPPPDIAQADATIEGIDANGNGIRDDVELAIFKKYPNEVYPVRSTASNGAKIRAAELQYAKALQVHLTLATNGDIYIFASELEDLSTSCLKNYTLNSPDPSESGEKWNQYYDKGDALISEVKNLMLNTSARKDKYDQIPERKATNYSLAQNDPACVLNPSLFQN